MSNFNSCKIILLRFGLEHERSSFHRALIKIQLVMWVLETNNIIFADPDHNQLEKVICLWYFETLSTFSTFVYILQSINSFHGFFRELWSQSKTGKIKVLSSWQISSPSRRSKFQAKMPRQFRFNSRAPYLAWLDFESSTFVFYRPIHF